MSVALLPLPLIKASICICKPSLHPQLLLLHAMLILQITSDP
jgi:hypothetical protein